MCEHGVPKTTRWAAGSVSFLPPCAAPASRRSGLQRVQDQQLLTACSSGTSLADSRLRPMDFQQTIRKQVSLAGIGLHSGEPVKMTLSPAAADTGVLFRAADGTFIPASAENVVDTRSATTVGAFGVRVRSIEHLMAALAGLGIDNILVDTDAEELPAA